jgi:hypothetical protein
VNNFLAKKKRGGIAENLVNSLFLNAGLHSDFAQTLDYDLEIFLSNMVVSVEVKFDEKERESGNIAIEVYNPKTDRPSGITITNATLWVVVLADLAVWVTTTDRLRRYIDHHPPVRIVDRAGDKNATLYLYESGVILSDIFIRIDNIDVGVVKSTIKNMTRIRKD